MTGVLLINMGGAESVAELKQFLRLMFLDKNVISAPYLIRKFLSVLISNTRYKKSWEKYKLIGGTPIKKNTHALAAQLQSILGNNFLVKEAYSYSKPFIAESIEEFTKKNTTKIIAVPLYPQASITTTSSVIADIEKIKNIYPELKISVIKEFYNHTNFIAFWSDLINKHIAEYKLNKPLLIFSAHSIPVSFIKKGDTYHKSIEKSAQLIAEKTGFDFRVSFQSGMNPNTWLGPDTKKLLATQVKNGSTEIVIIPISFVGDNLETLYDLDIDIVPWSNETFNIHVSRVRIPASQPLFISMLKDLIINKA